MNLMTNPTMINPETQSEWLDWYVRHGGNHDLKLADDETVLFHTQHGFVSFFIHDDILEIHHVAGNGKFWQNVLIQVMNFHHLNKARWFSKRNPKAWIRKFGGHIRGYYMECDLHEAKL